MTGIDKDIFRATRALTTLLNEALDHWNYLRPYLEKLSIAANRALEGYHKDYPDGVDTIITEDRKSAIRPLRQCDVGSAEEQTERFDAYCDSHTNCAHCPLKGQECCTLTWAQMPYESEVK